MSDDDLMEKMFGVKMPQPKELKQHAPPGYLHGHVLHAPAPMRTTYSLGSGVFKSTLLEPESTVRFRVHNPRWWQLGSHLRWQLARMRGVTGTVTASRLDEKHVYRQHELRAIKEA